MKNKKFVALLLCVSALGLGLASCSGNTAEESTSSSEVSRASRIRRETIPTLVINNEVNLDDYITIEYSDGSSDHGYEISTTSTGLTIDGHKISSSSTGSYRVEITAGTLSARIDLEFVTAEHKVVIDFVDNLTANPQNFSAEWIAASSSSSSGYYTVTTHYLTENYGLLLNPSYIYDEDYYGTIYNIGIATLSDGRSYWGHIVNDSGIMDVSFDPGYVSFDNYYFTLGYTYETLDPYSFEEVPVDDDSYLVTDDGDFGRMLCEWGLGLGGFLSYYEIEDTYSYYGAMLSGYTDDDNDGLADTMTFQVLITDGSTDAKGNLEFEGLCFVSFSDVGTTSLNLLETAIVDSSYVPVVPDTTELSTGFANLASGKNYTAEFTFEQLDSDAENVTDVSKVYDAMSHIYGANKISIKNTYTEDGVISVLSTEDLTYSYDSEGDENGIASIGELTQTSGWAAWSDGEKSWSTAYDSTAGKYDDASEVLSGTESTSDVYGAFINSNGYSASTVTSTAVGNTNWSTRTESSTANTITWEGTCGDNDGSSETNLLLRSVMAMFGPYTFASTWCDAQEFTGGEYHALSLSSDWDSIVYNTATGEITMEAVIYAPVGISNYDKTASAYIKMTIVISDIGTTTNDFSQFTTASAETAE